MNLTLLLIGYCITFIAAYLFYKRKMREAYVQIRKLTLYLDLIEYSQYSGWSEEEANIKTIYQQYRNDCQKHKCTDEQTISGITFVCEKFAHNPQLVQFLKSTVV